jgi:chromosome partitioning protein
VAEQGCHARDISYARTRMSATLQEETAAPGGMAPAAGSGAPARLATVLAVVNQKGGVGKTTTTMNLGAALAEKRRRVLLVDMDPQGNLTNALGLPLEYPSTYDLLLGQVPALEMRRSVLESALRIRRSSRAQRPVIDILPGIGELAGIEVELAEAEDKDRRLWLGLQPAMSEYDYILIDCPPSLGTLTLNALLAAHGVVAPVQCEYLALKGFMQLTETIRLVQEALNPHLRRVFLVMTMYSSRTLLAQNVVADARDQFPHSMMPTLIPRSTRFGESPSYGQSILRYEPSGRAAEAYRSLADDIDSRIRRDLRASRL